MVNFGSYSVLLQPSAWICSEVIRDVGSVSGIFNAVQNMVCFYLSLNSPNSKVVPWPKTEQIQEIYMYMFQPLRIQPNMSVQITLE